MSKPKLALDAIRLHRTPIYQNGQLTGFASDAVAEARGTLYLPAGGTMKLWQSLLADEQSELEALLDRVSKRILSAMTAALTPEEAQEPQDE